MRRPACQQAGLSRVAIGKNQTGYLFAYYENLLGELYKLANRPCGTRMGGRKQAEGVQQGSKERKECGDMGHLLNLDIWNHLIIRNVIRAVTLLCIVFSLSTPAGAADPFPVGWYDALSVPRNATNIALDGGNTSLAYWDGNHGSRSSYLDKAEAAGLRVIFEIDPALVAAEDAAGIRNLVNTYKHRSAIVGWYTCDEPLVNNIGLSTLQIAYDAVKQESNLPVSMLFSFLATRPQYNLPVEYKNSYDVFFMDHYPARVGEAEFSRLNNPNSTWPYDDDWMGNVRAANTQSQLAGKPWWNALQALARSTASTDFRLPTSKEARFMNYYSLSENASGLLHFVYYRLRGGGTPPQPTEPYVLGGDAWVDNIWKPLAAEANTLGPALQKGKISGVVSDNTADVRSDVYQDPDTHEYYLVTLNENTGSETTTFTLNMPGREWLAATPVSEYRDPIAINGSHQFSDGFSSYGVHVYLLHKSNSRNEDFESYSSTSSWSPSGGDWSVNTPNSGNSHQIATGTNGNGTKVYKADSRTTPVQNLLAYWDRTIPDADADVTKTSIEWQMTDGYANDQHRIGMSRMEGAAWSYTWSCVFGNNYQGSGEATGTMAVRNSESLEYETIDIPGGDSWQIDTWYTLEVEEDNREAGEGNGQRSRVRFGPIGGTMGDWTSWVSHWDGLDMDEAQIRLLTNGLCEYDNIEMLAKISPMAGPNWNEDFQRYNQTTTWNASSAQRWTVNTPNAGNSHQIAIGTNGNSTKVYKADSTADGQNMLAYWDRTIPDAEAVITITTIEWQMVAGYGANEDQYRTGMSRSESADYYYTWSCVFGNNVSGSNEITGTMAVYTGDEYITVNIPGGDDWDIDTWYVLEVEEDNGEAGVGNGQKSRARFGPVDGAMGNWTSWISHWADLDMDEGYIRLMTNGLCEYDHIDMIASPHAPEPASASLLLLGGLLLLRRRKK